MHAHDRTLPQWFEKVRTKELTLPRFQRMIAWSHSEVSDLLTTVLRRLPSGATLVLQVGNDEKFLSRTLTDAPEAGDRVTEQLLDGQQRISALWRSLNDLYEERTYLVGFEEDPHQPDQRLPYAQGVARYAKNGKRYPLWVDDPAECWKRELIPLRLLRPEEVTTETRQWIKAAVPGSGEEVIEKRDKLYDTITDLRLRVHDFNLPYLALPATTPEDVALEVFVKMNTSSVPLSAFDIVVALVEGKTGESLRDQVGALMDKVQRLSAYVSTTDFVLDVACLRQDKAPSRATYRRLDFERMMAEWDTLVASSAGMVTFLQEETVFDAQRLPSYTALPVLAALWEYLPQNADALGNARHLLRKFLWRAFLTPRYEQSSTSRALQDYRALKAVLEGRMDETQVPIFDAEQYPSPNADTLLTAEWPKRKTILGRGILALQLKCGAHDLADGTPATVASIAEAAKQREYHHLYPDALLKEADLPGDRIFRALNCALVTWRTNRTISRKDPIAYIRDRVNNSTLGEDEIRARVKTHLIPYDTLAVGSYDGLSEEERKPRIEQDYGAFLKARAGLIEKAARIACEGRSLELGMVFDADV